jgi:anti-sigma factor RsiW
MSSAISEDEAIDGHAITCAELVMLITDYLEGALPDEQRKHFEAHLAVCEGCQHYLEQIRLTIATVGLLREDGIPAEARDRFIAAFRTWNRAGS